MKKTMIRREQRHLEGPELAERRLPAAGEQRQAQDQQSPASCRGTGRSATRACSRINDRTKNRPKPTTRTSDAARSLCWSSQRVSVASCDPLSLDHPLVGDEAVGRRAQSQRPGRSGGCSSVVSLSWDM